MKNQNAWKKTPLGKAVFYIGSIRFAVPLLFITAASLMYGTWIESSQSAAMAGKVVYGSWWFIALMVTICTVLVLAVVTRLPLRKKHTGFVIVHASLILIFTAAFVTFFTKVEGEIALKEGTASESLRTGSNELQVLTHDAGKFELLDAVQIDGAGATVVNGFEVEILEQWENSTQETVVVNDGLNKLHAVELAFDDEQGEGYWIGQLRENETPPMLHGFEIRVLPEGETWSAPENGQESKPVFHHAKTEDLIYMTQSETSAGTAMGDGWSIESVRYFKHAIVEGEGLAEGESDRDNPAVEVVLVHENGSRERHAAFDRFRGSVNKKQLDGETFSQLALDYVGQGLDRATLAITHDGTVANAMFVNPGSEPVSHELKGEGPWAIELGDHIVTILHDYTNARGSTELVQAAQGPENSPALRVLVHGMPEKDGKPVEPMTLVWGQRSVIQIGEDIFGIGYAPTTIDVPFKVELIDFRKEDYPGSEMAMAYESDVIFTDADGNTHEQTIFMNNPLEYEGWKIYQAGFVGGDISIFQVTRDPGLAAMYLGCITLCFGICVMYYSKAYSHGHPGMPKVFEAKKKRSSTHAHAEHAIDDRHSTDDLTVVGQSGRTVRASMEDQTCDDSDPASRAHNAVGHIRKKGRSRSHRTHKVE